MKPALICLSLLLLSAPAIAASPNAAGPQHAQTPHNGQANGYQGQGNGLHLGHGGNVVGSPLPIVGGISAAVLFGAAFGLAHLRRRRQAR